MMTEAAEAPSVPTLVAENKVVPDDVAFFIEHGYEHLGIADGFHYFRNKSGDSVFVMSRSGRMELLGRKLSSDLMSRLVK